MTFSSAHMVDGAVLLIVVFSILIGFIRGATREVLGIAGWVGAFATVFYGLPLCRPFGRHYIHNAMIADAVTAGLLFVLSLAIFIIISRMLSSCIKGGILGGLDRSFGLVFGFVRGVLVVCMGYLAISFFYPPPEIPQAIQTARLTPWIVLGTEKLRLLIPKDYLPQDRALHTLVPSSAPDLLETHLSTLEDTVKHLSTLKPLSPQKAKNLDSLIEVYDTTSQE